MTRVGMAGVLALCAATLCAASARADIKYTSVSKSGEGDAAASPSNRTLHAVRNGAERTEMTMKIGKAEINNVSIRFCEPEKTVHLDDKLKIYYEDVAVAPAKSAGSVAGKSTPTGKSGKTGKMVSTYKVQDLGLETVADWKARHYKIQTKMEMSGCVGNSTLEMAFEYWVADVKDANPCKNVGNSAAMYGGMSKPDCIVSYETKGDVAAFNKAMSGLIVRTKMYMDGKLTSTTEVTSLSQAKLGDELFTVPAGYKKVTEAEFQKAQQTAMMQAMMGGQMPVGDDE